MTIIHRTQANKCQVSESEKNCFSKKKALLVSGAEIVQLLSPIRSYQFYLDKKIKNF